MKVTISIISLLFIPLCLFSQGRIIIQGNSNSDINNIRQITTYDNRITKNTITKNQYFDNSTYCYTTVNNFTQNYTVTVGSFVEDYKQIIQSIESQLFADQDKANAKKIKSKINDLEAVSDIGVFLKLNLDIIKELTNLLSSIDKSKQIVLLESLKSFEFQLSEINCTIDDYEIRTFGNQAVLLRKSSPLKDVDLIVDNYHNGYARVKFNNKIGLIDLAGKFVIPPTWDYATNVEDSILIVRNGDNYYMIDPNGRIIMNYVNIADSVGVISEGLIVIKVGKYYKYIDKKGKIIIDDEYYRASNFRHGYASVQIADSYYYNSENNTEIPIYQNVFINNVGKRVSSLYDFATAFSPKGLAIVDGRIFPIDQNGDNKILPKKVINTQFRDTSATYDNLRFANNNYIITENNGKIGFNSDENVIKYSCELDYFDGFYRDVAIVGKIIDNKMKYALINTNGMLLTKFIYYRIEATNTHCFTLYQTKNKFKKYIVDYLGILIEISE